MAALIGDPTYADAILDRIVHNAYRFALEGPSMRKPEAAEADAPANGADSATAISTKPTKEPGNDRRAQAPARPRGSTATSRARRYI